VSAAGDGAALGEDVSLVVEEARFALVPEWVIDAPIPDSSFRLYSLLLRYGGTSGQRMPSRTTLARRMHRSVDAVDRAMRELVSAGIVRVEHRRIGQQYLSNRYHVRTSAPFPAAPRVSAISRSSTDVPVPSSSSLEGSRTKAPAPGRSDAATLGPGLVPAPGRSHAATSGGGLAPTPGRSDAATPSRRAAATPGRTDAGRVAVDVRHDRELSTQSTSPPPAGSPPPPPPRRSPVRRVGEVEAQLLAECGVADLRELADRCRAARRALGLSVTRWAPQCLSAALHLSVRGRGWPAELAASALVAVAADPASQSPMRLAEAGPWWDQVTADAARGGGHPGADALALLEQRLVELGGQRVALQARARAELASEGLPVTRSTVLRRSCALLDAQSAG